MSTHSFSTGMLMHFGRFSAVPCHQSPIQFCESMCNNCSWMHAIAVSHIRCRRTHECASWSRIIIICHVALLTPASRHHGGWWKLSNSKIVVFFIKQITVWLLFAYIVLLRFFMHLFVWMHPINPMRNVYQLPDCLHRSDADPASMPPFIIRKTKQIQQRQMHETFRQLMVKLLNILICCNKTSNSRQ